MSCTSLIFPNFHTFLWFFSLMHSTPELFSTLEEQGGCIYKLICQVDYCDHLMLAGLEQLHLATAFQFPTKRNILFYANYLWRQSFPSFVTLKSHFPSVCNAHHKHHSSSFLKFWKNQRITISLPVINALTWIHSKLNLFPSSSSAFLQWSSSCCHLIRKSGASSYKSSAHPSKKRKHQFVLPQLLATESNCWATSAPWLNIKRSGWFSQKWKEQFR